MSLQIFYGVDNHYRNVTQRAFQILSRKPEFINKKQLIIPKIDTTRAAIFGDPIIGVIKHILVIHNDIKTIHGPNDDTIIDISNIDYSEYLLNKLDKQKLHSLTVPEEKLNFIHQNIVLNHGDIMGEYPEQLMSCRFIKPEFRVLEIGSNIGRNTLVISTILDDDKNLVTLESDQSTIPLLKYNKEINDYNFHIENSALSKRKLVQKGWETIPSDQEIPGYTRVKTITFSELEEKYKITFDTLVADCEGALYYIFLDDPEMLNNFKLILMENDYTNILHKQKVDEILTNKGFKRIYKEAGGWGPCYDFFFEAWGK